MMRDKKRDRVRSILPSTGRKNARENSRIINRRTRHRTKQALHEHIDDEDFDDSAFFIKTSKVQASHKSDMKQMVYSRRNGDKLGPLMRYVEYIKLRSNNDQEARDKIVNEIEPGKNLITRHAMGHADGRLDCPGSRYTYPLENERDTKARENEARIRSRNRNGKVVWGKRQFKRIIRFLAENEHKALNRALKHTGLSIRPCIEGKDSCSTIYVKTSIIREVFDPQHWSCWRQVYNVAKFVELMESGEKTRVREVVTREPRHNTVICKNKLMVYKPEDYLVVVRVLLRHTEAIYENDIEKPTSKNLFHHRHGASGKYQALRGIKILVDKHQL